MASEDVQDDGAKKLHEYLRELRERAGIEQKVLAEEIGVDATLLNAYERSRRRMPVDLPGKYIEAVQRIARKRAEDVEAI